jgi:hypothetical protein
MKKYLLAAVAALALGGLRTAPKPSRPRSLGSNSECHGGHGTAAKPNSVKAGVISALYPRPDAAGSTGPSALAVVRATCRSTAGTIESVAAA